MRCANKTVNDNHYTIYITKLMVEGEYEEANKLLNKDIIRKGQNIRKIYQALEMTEIELSKIRTNVSNFKSERCSAKCSSCNYR